MGAREFYGALVGLRSGIAEEAGGQPVVEQLYEPFGEQAAEQRAVELHHVGQIHVNGVFERFGDNRMVAAHAVYTVAGDEVEVVVALRVVEVRALGAGVALVEAYRFQNRRERAVHVEVVKFVIFAAPRLDELPYVKFFRCHMKISPLNLGAKKNTST